MTATQTKRDATIFARVPTRLADDFKREAEEHGSTLSADVRQSLELIYALRMMEALADPANFKANVAHFGSPEEVHVYWQSYRDDVIGLLATLVPSAAARQRLDLPEFMSQEPPTRLGKASK